MRLNKLILYKLILVFIIIFPLFGFIHEKEVYKYFEIKKLPCIEKIVYSEKKVFNNLIIEIKDGYADIHILCVPFTPQEYEESISNKLKNYKLKRTRDSITLKISSRKIKAIKEFLGDNNCYIICNDYYRGIALFLTYFGDCDTSKFLNNILSSFKYRISKEKIQDSRRDFLYIMNLIETLEVPIYPDSFNIKRKYTLVGLGKSITYNTNIEAYSTKVLEFYKEYFSSLDCNPLRMEEQENWHNQKIFYRWMDKTEEMVVRLILSQDKNELGKLSKQSVYIDVTPYIVQEWGQR